MQSSATNNAVLSNQSPGRSHQANNRHIYTDKDKDTKTKTDKTDTASVTQWIALQMNAVFRKATHGQILMYCLGFKQT